MKLVVLPGDGIGPEICAVTVSVLKKLDLGLMFETHEVGLASLKPPALLLFNSPLIPGAHFDEIKINLILKLCRILPQAPKAKEAPRQDAGAVTTIGTQ